MKRVKRILGCYLAAATVLATGASAEEVLREFTLNSQSTVGAVVEQLIPESMGWGLDDDGEVLFLQNQHQRDARIPILYVDDPGISSTRYAIVGNIRHDAIMGQGFLEMWSTFADGNRYFSRGLENVGPTRVITGSTDWRTFVLPLYLEIEKTGTPVALQLNVVLPPESQVEIRDVRLVQYEAYEDPLAVSTSSGWWGSRQAGLVGAYGGITLGLLGAMVGLLAGTGRGRNLVMALLIGGTLLGALCLVLGVTALVIKQPYAVYYPLLLLGALATFIPLGILPTIRRRYQAQELRKMEAMDRG